jgi:GntR family transcriptional regulator / MocR family aminotransferase
MAKYANVHVLPLEPRDRSVPAYAWLSAALREEILAGRLRPGARLASTRVMASQYGLSRGTVISAYEQLRSEGYVEGAVGSGTYVNRVLPDDLLHVSRRPDVQSGPRSMRTRRLSSFARRLRPFPLGEPRAPRAFRPDQPAVDLFPTTLWAQMVARRARMASPKTLLGCGPMGQLPLREAIAEYLQTARGVRCTADQVAVVSGVQEALDLLSRVTLEPGEPVCMESPGYIGATLVFRALGVRICPVAVDAEGMRVPDSRARDARLAYVTPGHQFPLGMTMSLPRRLELLEWARTTGALIVEDDYDSEYRYSGRPIPALQGLDQHGLVALVGSFSKVLFPSLRLGYLVVPPDLVDIVAAAKSVATRHAPVLDQAILCDFITAGHFGRHLRRMREVYAERWGVLLEEAERHLSGLLEIAGVEAGLQTAGWLAPGVTGVGAARAAAAREVEVVPLSEYDLRPSSREGLQLGFAAVDPHEIRRGVRSLALALETEGGRQRVEG